MLFDELRQVRAVIQQGMQECLKGQISCENKISVMNSFFMSKLDEKEAQIKELSS